MLLVRVRVSGHVMCMCSCSCSCLCLCLLESGLWKNKLDKAIIEKVSTSGLEQEGYTNIPLFHCIYHTSASFLNA